MTVHTARSGWKPQEIDVLMNAVHKADAEGAPLRSVFEETARTLGRKPNSVRNFYYLQIRADPSLAQRRAEPFVTFTEEEVAELVKQVMLAKANGQSVRSCVMALSGGDKTKMLRYQNKYRAVLRKRPQLIEDICCALEKEGRAFVNPLKEGNAIARPDANAEKCLQALDRLKVQADLMRMQLEDLQLAARDTLLLCKDFLGLLPEEKQANLPLFCRTLTESMARLENAATLS